MKALLPLAVVAMVGPPVAALDPPVARGATFASAAEIEDTVASMKRELKPGQGFLSRPLVEADRTVAALEYWRSPGRPAVHPSEAEYAIVVGGSGTLVSGGRLIDEVVKRPGLTEGSRIEGGTTRTLRKGDVILIPAGIPHWFGITEGKLVLLGTKITA